MPLYYKFKPSDVAAVNAAKGDILSSQTILGVTGTYDPGEPMLLGPLTRYPPASRVAVVPLDTAASITNLANGTATVDSTNVLHSSVYPPTSVKVTKATSGAACTFRASPASPINAPHSVMVLWFYLHPGADAASGNRMDYINLILWNSAYSAYNSYDMKLPNAIGDESGAAGWYCADICLDTPTATSGGGINGTDIKRIDFTFVPIANTTTNTPSITFDALEFWASPFAAPWFTVRIDSSIQAGLTACTALAGLGSPVKATLGIDLDLIGSGGGNLTLANLATIAGQGHQLVHYPGGSLSWISWVSKTLAQKRAILAYGAQWCAANSMTPDIARTISGPGNSGFVPHDRRLMLEAGVHQYSLGQILGQVNLMQTAFRPQNYYTSYFMSAAGEGTTTPAAVTALITKISTAAAAGANFGFALGTHVATENDRTTLMAIVADFQAAGFVNKTWNDVLLM